MASEGGMHELDGLHDHGLARVHVHHGLALDEQHHVPHDRHPHREIGEHGVSEAPAMDDNTMELMLYYSMPHHAAEQEGVQRRQTRQRYRIKSAEQQAALRKAFAENPRPHRTLLASIAVRLGLTYEETQRWFRDRRTMVKQGTLPVHELREQHHQQQHQLPSLPVPLAPQEIERQQRLEQRRRSMSPSESSPEPPRLSASRAAAPGSHRHTCLHAFIQVPQRSRERVDLLIDLAANFSTEDRRVMRQLMSNRVGSASVMSGAGQARRAREAWLSLQELFGVREDLTTTTGELDRDMTAGLENLFRTHRDYLVHLARHFSIDKVLRQEQGVGAPYSREAGERPAVSKRTGSMAGAVEELEPIMNVEYHA